MAAVLAGCGSTPQDEHAGKSVEELYAEAREEMEAGAFDRATTLYEKLEARAAGTPLAEQAQLDLAHAYYKARERALALSTIERFLKRHPSSPAADYAWYLQGLINFNEDLGLFSRFSGQDLSERDQQASRDAYQAFKQVVEGWPESKYAEDSRLRMNYILNALATYEVHVARYYYRRGAYLAAANRAQQAVQEFQTAPAIEEALFLMAASYDKLGMAQLRDDAMRVLNTSFPDSEFPRRGLAEIDRSWWRLW
jgi:outer membrane protein assembly factor BamD